MKEETYRLIMIIGLYLGIILFLIAIIALVKNVQEIKEDPIVYGIQKKNFESCVCYDLEMNKYGYNSVGVVPTERINLFGGLD